MDGFANMPSTDATKVVNVACLSSQALRYLYFLSSSAESRTAKTERDAQGGASVSTTRIANNAVIIRIQNKRIWQSVGNNVCMFTPGAYGSPYATHSLSWSSNKENGCTNGMMFAKVWTPEDPRTVKGGHNSSVTFPLDS